jgi:GDPmannose 4,6-dehydratase
MRGETFVTRKITRGAVRVCLGMDEAIYLGNLDAQRDWGHAKDYVEGMWRMLQQDKPEDFVLATGKTTTIREMVIKTFSCLGVELEFKGVGQNEVGVVANCNGEFNLEKGKVVIKIDPRYFRPTEVDLLIGDATKAHEKLGWKPKYTFDDLVEDMVQSDLKLLKRDLYLKEFDSRTENNV